MMKCMHQDIHEFKDSNNIHGMIYWLLVKKYRKKHDLKKEDIVILLTDIGNHRNWFTGYDESGASNFFVHTQMWDYYIDGDIRYPISYQIAYCCLKMGCFKLPSNYSHHSINRVGDA